MNGVHDLGGVHGFGPIDAEPEQREPLFHHDWEPAVMNSMYGTLRLGRWSLDEFRYAIESQPPLDYLRCTYYEKWLAALEQLVVQHGLITEAELLSGKASSPVEPDDHPWTPTFEPPTTPPRFTVGQAVRAVNRHPRLHTREPRYIRGRAGTIVSVAGAEPLPEDACRKVDHCEHVYLVRFEAAELWGPDAAGKDAVYLELWESYLEARS